MSASAQRFGGATLVRAAVFALACAPLVRLAVDAARDDLTANPIAEVMNRLGFWTLTWLMASLLPTPLKAVLGWTWPMRVRRMLGLFAFAYGALHFATYLALDQTFDFAEVGRDVVKRPFITVGVVAFSLLVPLALTSTNAAVKRLGFARWKRLHRLVYLAAALGIVHFVWRVKADYVEPALFAAVLALALTVRFIDARRARRARRARKRSQRGAPAAPGLSRSAGPAPRG